MSEGNIKSEQITPPINHNTTTRGATMQQHTNTSILAARGISLDNIEHLDLEVPIVSGNQRQGDVYVLKVTTDRAEGAQKIGPKGITVVRAETSSANTHTLYALAGECLWLPNARASQDDELVQGWLTVTDGAEATLIHTEEHNVLGIGAGTYEIRRQREFAGEWQRVAD